MVAAIRRGLEGWEPTWDVATTTVRIRDVFSMHPPLTGMAAAPSVSADIAYSFPGPLHLYLVAIPVEVLGTTWGLLLGMAVVNTLICVAAIWLIRRRMGERWAMVGALVLATLMWTLGSGMLIYPTPLAIGVVPLFAFLVAAWSLADDDGPAWPVCAFLANYLFLDQLVFIVIVPLVGFVALVMNGARLWRIRRREPDHWPAHRRSRIGWAASAVVVTVVAWIPPLVDQFVKPGHNLGKIVHAFTSATGADGHLAGQSPTLAGALGVVASVTAVPRAWLPPSFRTVPFDTDGGGSSFVVGLVWTVVLLGVLGWAAWRARRRGDTRVTAAVAVAVTGWLAYIITAMQNPDWQGFAQRYFLGLWALGAFMWLVALVGVATALPGLVERLRARSTTGLALLTLTVMVVASAAGYRQTSARALDPSRTSPLAAQIRHAVKDPRIGPGPVLVDTYPRTGGSARQYLPSVLLGLQDAGIEFRVRGAFDAQQFGAWRSFDQDRDATTKLVVSTVARGASGERPFAVVRPPAVISDRAYAAYTAHMRSWAESLTELRTNPRLSIDRDERLALDRKFAAAFDAIDRDGLRLLSMPFFVGMLQRTYEDGGALIIDVPGMTDRDVELWAKEWGRRVVSSVYLYLEPVR